MVHFYIRIFTFFVGVLIGILIAFQCKQPLHAKTTTKVPYLQRNPSYNSWFGNLGFKRTELLWDKLRYEKNINYLIESHFLSKKIRILCVVLVRNPKNVEAIENTWGKGCNSIKFLELAGKANGTIIIKRRKENSSWVLLCTFFTTISNHSDYDWTLIVNDNTFAILENLRYYVAGFNSSENHYLGHAVSFWNTIYNSGEAGYVLSGGTVKALIKTFKHNGCFTNVYWNREDFYLGKYLASLNIVPVDTRDREGFSMFHPYNWYHLFFPGENYYKTSVFPVKCCSKSSITFQAVEGDKMYTYYYLLYTLQIFLDGNLGNAPPPTSIPEEEIWHRFLRERNIHDYNISSGEYYKIWEDLVNDPSSFAAHMKKEMDYDYD
ncbi:hypothetical protein NQ317_004317 [Molorchus minor]|uniref:Glycoprotein-N-acetylgalactosamine 3-beta-galactosyltransferase 1 n=1 Tax=Molorchus minor TaxID=1323400 RepID=A0ABQ9JYE4_9CUCU|nr:hypothetical protein NQ317_004317 [Molorchus minor]